LADDGTIEAIRIADAPGFALGVQWHAEYDPQYNPVNRALFQAFGKAITEHARGAPKLSVTARDSGRPGIPER
jgi:putative glutamine amidotransferase